MSLPDFLLARIDEEEQLARSMISAGFGTGKPGIVETQDYEGWPILRTHPERLLAECEAKRRIVERFPQAAQDGDGWNEAGLQVLELLASVYADHPDFSPEWRVQ